MQYGGATEFYDQASAGSAKFYNEVANGVTQNSLTAGNRRFYGNSTAANATFYNKRGGGSTFFYNPQPLATARSSSKTREGVSKDMSVSRQFQGGHGRLHHQAALLRRLVFFHDSSNAEQAQITLEDGSQAACILARLQHGTCQYRYWLRGGLGCAGFGDRRQRHHPSSGMVVQEFHRALATAGDANFTLHGGTVSGGGGGEPLFLRWQCRQFHDQRRWRCRTGCVGGRLHFGAGANARNRNRECREWCCRRSRAAESILVVTRSRLMLVSWSVPAVSSFCLRVAL